MYIVGKCRLRILLKNRKMSQTELAHKINVTPQQINGYVTGKRIMSMTVAKNIASVFDCSIDDLYDWIPVDLHE